MSSSESLELPSVPFLPVDPSFSTTRNQGRQKLARFTVPELKQLVTDLLIEVRRRQSPFLTGNPYKFKSNDKIITINEVIKYQNMKFFLQMPVPNIYRVSLTMSLCMTLWLLTKITLYHQHQLILR